MLCRESIKGRPWGGLPQFSTSSCRGRNANTRRDTVHILYTSRYVRAVILQIENTAPFTMYSITIEENILIQSKFSTFLTGVSDDRQILNDRHLM